MRNSPPQFGRPLGVPAYDVPVLELADMYAVAAPAKLGGSLVKPLGAVAPMGRMQHVKRVRKAAEAPQQLEILLCPVDWDLQQQQEYGQPNTLPLQQQQQQLSEVQPPSDGGDPQPAARALPPGVAEIVQQHSLQPFVVQVPRHAPQTREQLTEWSAHWPLYWRPPDASSQPHLAELPAAEVSAMQRHMGTAWRLAAQNGAAGRVANACVLVDPERDAVVASVADCTHEHPLRHAAMAAVAAAAEWQLGVWPPEPRRQQANQGPSSSGDKLEAAAAAAVALAAAAAGAAGNGSGPGGGEACDGKRRRLEGSHDVHDAAHEETAGKSSGDRGSGGGVGEQAHKHRLPGQQEEPPAGRAVGQHAAWAAAIAAAGPAAEAETGPGPAAGAGADGSSGGSSGQEGGAAPAPGPGRRPYLCTGYDCYLVQEPCVMCAMALVHSRLRRVVFCLPDERWGALGGSFKLHAQRSLNHHYTVFRLPLAGEGDAGA